MNPYVPETRIALLSTDNAGAFTELSLQLWKENTYPETYAAWQQLISHRNHYCALAIHEEQYAGFIHISIRHDYVEGADHPATAYLEAIYVLPEYRRLRIASQLLTAGISWAKTRGLTQLGADTATGNAISQAFHLQSGFKEVNRVVCYLREI